MAIDVGADAIARALTVSHPTFALCLIEGTNPAASAGTIRKVYFYLQGISTAGVTVGTFYKTNGNTFSSRDHETLSGIALGLNEKTVSLDIQVGDYIGVLLQQQASGDGLALDYDAGWTNDYWRTLEGTTFPYTSYTFDNLGKRIISIYGELGTDPVVTTSTMYSVSTTSAVAAGNITSLGVPNPTAHGVCYNTTGSPTTADSTTDEGAAAATGAFTTAMSSLTLGTKYYVKAYATNTNGTSYGSEITFIAGEKWYPTDPTTRVTSLVHRFDRSAGIYTLGLGLGDVIIGETPLEALVKRVTGQIDVAKTGEYVTGAQERPTTYEPLLPGRPQIRTSPVPVPAPHPLPTPVDPITKGLELTQFDPGFREIRPSLLDRFRAWLRKKTYG